jgi:DNA-binding MarR family transcriptional regulator
MTDSELNEQERAAFALLKARPEGVLQSDLWKEMNINSRACSRILKTLEDGGYITRTTHTKDGCRTYLIQLIPREVAVDPSLLMAGDSIVPCVACDEECDVEHCKLLEDWMYELVFAEMD